MPNLARAAWLQAMMTHRIVTDKQGRTLHKAACTAARAEYDADAYDDFVLDASSALSVLGLELRRMIDEWTGKPLMALVNTKGDEIAQAASTYTPQELSFLKAIVEEIFTAPDDSYSISTIAALKHTSKSKTTMTKKSAEELLDNLVAHRWLVRSESGRLSLSVRCLLELQGWLKEQFPEHAIECSRCHDLVTRGNACTAVDCSGRLHHACEKKLSGYRQGSAKCPECHADWNPTAIGEEALSAPSNRNRRRQRDQAAADTPARRTDDSTADPNGEDEPEEHAEDAESDDGDTGRRSSHAAGSRRSADRAPGQQASKRRRV